MQGSRPNFVPLEGPRLCQFGTGKKGFKTQAGPKKLPSPRALAPSTGRPWAEGIVASGMELFYA